MSKILTCNVLFLLLVWMTGCDSMFDDELPPHDLVGENAITNESSAETALNGIFSNLQGYGTMSANYICDNEYRTGLLSGTYRGTFETDGLLGFKLTEEYTYVADPWERAYKMVNAANNFIYYVEKLSESLFGENRKTEMLAEARFARAFGHAFLLRRYGYFWDINSPLGPIIRLEPSSISNNSMGRSSVKDSYESIFADLDYAIEFGPRFYSRYRSCATTAKAFKADILMNRGGEGDYAEAIRLADEVIGSDEFGLEDTYGAIFSNGYGSKELMLTRHLKSPPAMDDNVASLYKMFGGATYKPTDLYFEIMTPEDKRYEETFDSVMLGNGTAARKTQVWKKHYVTTGDCPMYYMRVAQMYLIKAEAMARTNASVKDCLDVLNVLRKRSGNTLFEAADYPSLEAVLEEVFRENVREIGMENGAIFYLTVRYVDGGNRKLKTMNPNFENDDQLCFPIPKAELEHNFDVEQKPL